MIQTNDDVIINWHNTAFFFFKRQLKFTYSDQWQKKILMQNYYLRPFYLENVWNDDYFFRQEGFYEDMPMEGQIGHRKIYLKQVK